MKPDREKAEKRVKILWEFYYKNGKLLIADIEALVGVPRDTLYDMFSTNGIDAPPVWNSQIEKTRRKAELLTNEALRLNQSFLTKAQAAKALKIKPNRVIGVTIQITKQGHKFPKIIDRVESLPVSMHGHINTAYYPLGLQVLSWWYGPTKKEITYLLR